MDPEHTDLLVSFATNIASQLVYSAVAKVNRFSANDGSTTGAMGIVPILDAQGNVASVLTGTQAEQVNEFLRDPRAKLHAEAFALAPIAATGEDLEEAKMAIRESFLSFTKEASFGIDLPTWELIWDTYETEIASVFDASQIVGSLTPSHRESLRDSLAPLAFQRGQRASVPIWLRDLVDLASQLDRLTEARIVAADIRREMIRDVANLVLDHALEDARKPIQQLYVERTLLEPGGAEFSSEFLRNSRSWRAVVTGDPGVGKTTLTQHVLHQVSSSIDGPVPLRTRAREIDLSNELLSESIASGARKDFQLADVTREKIEDLLAVGDAVVVFDGVDEVLDLGDRRTLLRRIESFCARYPLCSVLVTSRTVGYELAPLSEDVFTHYELLPFSDAQVAEYAEKWFKSRGKDDDIVAAFIRDLDTVEDLRTNPLLLSLICTLYKFRGEIPRNRRMIYTQCADLLFTRWDSMRKIDQPVDHSMHGHDMIQDIALWFFNSQTAQRGVQRGQLIGIVAQYLEDSAGVLPGSAKFRAGKFVDFCADRAWLLAKNGTSATGEALFTFTHRTFMEFFAAERLARGNNNNPEALAKIICEQYAKNPSSVLPELIVSAAEASQRDASREIVQAIKGNEKLTGGKGHGRFLPVRLRITAVLPLRPPIQNEIFEDSLDYLSDRTAPDKVRVFEALLELPRDPYARLRAHLLASDDLGHSLDAARVRKWQAAFVEAWAMKNSANQPRLYQVDWSSLIGEICDRIADTDAPRDNRAIRSYFLSVGRRSIPLLSIDTEPWVKTHSGDGLPGPLLTTVQRSLRGESLDQVDAELQALASKFSPGRPLAEEVAWNILRAVRPMVYLATVSEGRPALHPDIGRYLLFLILVGSEAKEWESDEVERVSEILGIDIYRLQITRACQAGEIDESQHAFTTGEMRQLQEDSPPWVIKWARDKLDLVADMV